MFKLKISIFCLGFYCIMLSSLYAASANPDNPLESLAQIQVAIDAADGENFQRLIDLDNIGNSALNSFLSLMERPENASQLSPMLSIIISQLHSQNQIRGLLLNEGKAFVLNGITSGSFAGKSKDNNSRASGFLAPLFANASMGRKQITDIGDPAAEGDHWLVPFAIYDAGNGNSYPVIGKFEIRDGICRLTDIANYEQIFNQIARESGF